MQKDEIQVEQRKVAIPLDYATLSKMVVAELDSLERRKSYYKKYNQEQISKLLENPSKHEKTLRDISNYLYHSSSHYKRLIKYFADMLLLYYIIIPYKINLDKVNIKAFKNTYKKILYFVETMNIQHEFKKVLNTVFREDCFYGYVLSEDDSFSIKQLDPNYCKLSKIEDGVYNFTFDFSYFDRNKDKLEYYPAEFKKKYKLYLKDRVKNKLQELSAENSICIKANEDTSAVVPPFLGVFYSIMEIQEYKELKKSKEIIDLYKLLIQKIPMREKSENNNDFSITLDFVKEFHNQIASILPDEIGIATTPMNIDEVTFNKDKAESNRVAEAESEFFNAAGVSSSLFNAEKTGSIGLNRSIEVDENVCFTVLRQIERWINRKLKYFNTSSYKFKIKMLNITQFNKKDVFKKYLEASQYGLPTKTMAMASLGLSPDDMNNTLFLENNVLELHDKFIPLSSSHTQSGDSGRPKKDEDDLSDGGIKTRDGDGNDNRAK